MPCVANHAEENLPSVPNMDTFKCTTNCESPFPINLNAIRYPEFFIFTDTHEEDFHSR